jgi:hypothetical protein
LPQQNQNVTSFFAAVQLYLQYSQLSKASKSKQTKKSKTNLKTLVSPLLIRPQGKYFTMAMKMSQNFSN